MTLATHRVVGLLDLPTGSELSPELLDVLRRDVPSDDHAPSMVLSLRLPICEAPHAEMLSADLNQLRIDLGRLFAEVSVCETL